MRYEDTLPSAVKCLKTPEDAAYMPGISEALKSMSEAIESEKALSLEAEKVQPSPKKMKAKRSHRHRARRAAAALHTS